MRWKEGIEGCHSFKINQEGRSVSPRSPGWMGLAFILSFSLVFFLVVFFFF